MPFYSSKHSFNYINQYNHISKSNWNKILKCDWIEAQFENQQDRVHKLYLCNWRLHINCIKVLFFAKTSEPISFYEIMTLFDLWIFCYFWIKTSYFPVCLNNVLLNHFKWPNRFTLTLYTLTSLCIFSILFSIHSQRCSQGEFVSQSNTSYVAGCFLILTTLMCDLRVIL